MDPATRKKRQKDRESAGGGNGNGMITSCDREWVEGLLYCHSRMNANTNKILEVGSFAYALIELLIERGLISIEEIDRKKEEVFRRLKKKYSERGMGVAVLKDDRDKYTFGEEMRINCASRIHLCQAVCCRLSFALSKQDVEEGKVWWEPGQPYMIAKGSMGYCRHLDPDHSTCTIYGSRPLACRAYDCRNDQRIWLDFDNMILNPNLEDLFQQMPSERNNSMDHQSEKGL